MTASERLRALDGAVAAAEEAMTVAELLRQRFAEIDEAEEIGVPVDAILSLVEAAEAVADPENDTSEARRLVRGPLTVLKERLEGGDE